MLPQTFETERLLARLPAPADAKHLFSAYTSNPAVSRYMMWRPHTEVGTTEAFVLEPLIFHHDMITKEASINRQSIRGELVEPHAHSMESNPCTTTLRHAQGERAI